MSYTPTVWASGDIVTSTKLNKLENGVASAGGGGGVLIVNVDENYTLDKTWQEIYDAFSSGTNVIMSYTNTSDGGGFTVTEYGTTSVQEVGFSSNEQYFVVFSGGGAHCNSADGYPSVGEEDWQ